MNREPALIIAAIMAVLNVIVGFGLEVETDQLALIDVALFAIAGAIVRQKVTPVDDA